MILRFNCIINKVIFLILTMIILVTFSGSKIRSSDIKYSEYCLTYNNNNIKINCTMSEDNILMIPLIETVNLLGFGSNNECHKCYQNIIFFKNTNESNIKGNIIIHWENNLVTFSENDEVLKLDTKTIKLNDDITYSSIKLLEYLGFEYKINDLSKTIEVNKKIDEIKNIPDNKSPKINERYDNSPKIIDSNIKKTIVYFYSSSCSSCKKTASVLDKINFNSITIDKYDIANPVNLSYLKLYCKKYNVEVNKIQMVPAIFISDKYLVGEDEILLNLNDYINNYSIETKTINEITNDNSNDVNLSILELIVIIIVNVITLLFMIIFISKFLFNV